MRIAIPILGAAGLFALWVLRHPAAPERSRTRAPGPVDEPQRTATAPAVDVPEGPGVAEGRVRDAAGRAVAAAVVSARRKDDNELLRASAATDASGAFVLRRLPMEPLRLIARTADSVSGAVEVDPRESGAREVAFVLRPAGVLAVEPPRPVSGRLGRWRDGPHPGRLLAPFGRIRATVHVGTARYHFDADVPGTLAFRVPADAVTLRGTVNVPGATIAAAGERGAVEGVASNDGAFALAGVPPGPATLTATAPGHVPFTRKIVVGRDEDIAVRLGTGWTSRGRVTDWDGQPVGGARVEGGGHDATTAADGSFRLGGLPGDEAVLRVHAVGFRSGRVHARRGRSVTIRLEPGWTLRGVVKGGAGALVGVWDPEWSGRMELRPAAFAIAAPDGSFEITGVPHGREWTVQAIASGSRSERAGPFAGPPDEPLRLSMRPAGVLRGVVRDANGAPVEAAKVVLVHPSLSVVSGPDGRFRFSGLEPGRHAVYVRPDDLVVVDVPSGESGEIVVPADPRYAISGVLVRPDETPVAGTQIVVRGSDFGWISGIGQVGDAGGATITDGRGRFRIAGLHGGDRHYRFDVEWKKVQGEWRAPAEDIRVVWKPEPPDPSRPVHGIVVDPEGRPVARATAMIRGRYRHDLEVREGVLSCELAPEVEGIRIVIRRARDAAGKRLAAGVLRVERRVPAGDGDLGELRLPPGRLWSGRIVDERGRGVPGASVEIAYRRQQDRGGSRMHDGEFSFDYPDDAVTSGADGSFSFPDLSAEPFWARVKTPPAFVYREPLRIDRPGAVPKIVVRDAYVQEGRVVGPDGNGIADVTILTSTDAWDGDDTWSGAPFARTDGRGRFRLGSLLPGSDVTLYVRPEGGAATPYLRREVPVRAGGDPVTVRLERGHWLEAELVDDRGRPILDGAVKAYTVGGERTLAYASLDLEKRIRLGPLPEGEYEMRLRSGERWDLPFLLPKPYRFRLPTPGVARVPVVRTWKLRGRVSESVRGFSAQWMADEPTKSGRGFGASFSDGLPTATPDAAGRFRFESLREPSGWVYVFSETSDRYALAAVDRGGGPVRLSLEDGLSLRGRYTGLAPATLYAVQGPLRRKFAVSADGAFHVRGLPPSRWRIEGGPYHPVATVVVEAGATDVVVRPED